MALKIDDNCMTLELDGRVIATARFSEHAAANGHGAWIVSCHQRRLFTRNQAITALVLAERIAAGYGDDDPFVIVSRSSRREGHLHVDLAPRDCVPC